MRIAALALVLATVGAAGAMAQPAGREPVVIEVNGAAVVSVVPDEATVVATVSSSEETSGAAREQNAREVARLVAFLKGLGVAEQDIQTEPVRVLPRNRPTTYPLPGEGGSEDAKPGPPASGFMATTRVEARFSDLAKAAQFAEKARDNGASVLQPVRYSVLDPAAGADRARRAAFDAARRKAEGLAAMAGLKLGRIVRISIPSRDLLALVAGTNASANGPQADDVVRIRSDVPAGVKPVEVRASLDVTWTAE